MVATSVPNKESTPGAPRKALATRKAVRPRAEGRPYKKLEASILTARMADLGKKLGVIEAKAVLLRDRLQQYQREETLRAETTETTEAAEAAV